MSSDIGIGGQVFADGSDLSRGLSAFRATFVQGNVDNTRLRTPARFRTHAVTLDGGSMGFTGDLPDDDADALVYAQDFLTRDDEPRTLFMAPFGADVGKLTLIGKGIRTTMELGAEIEAILSLNAEFEITAASPGIMPGLTLFSPNLEGGTLTQNEMADLVFTNADPNQFFALKAAGTSQTFGFQTAITNAALEAGVEALPAYVGRDATVTGSALTGSTLKSGSKRIEFNGAVDVPALELLQGALHTLTLINATGTKTIYGNVVVDVSTSTASSVQTAVRAKGGEYANVVVTKTGSGGTAVYSFAYPVGATPAALTQPTTPLAQTQTLKTVGGTFVASTVSVVGPSATVQVTPGDSTGAVANNVSTAYGLANGSHGVTGSTVAPGPSKITLSGATSGSAATNGDYFPRGDQIQGYDVHELSTNSDIIMRRDSSGVPSHPWIVMSLTNGVHFRGTDPNSAQHPGADTVWALSNAALVGSGAGQIGTGAIPTTTYTPPTSAGSLDLVITDNTANRQLATLTTPTAGASIVQTQAGGTGPDPQTSVSVTQGGDATTVAYSLVQQGGSFTGVNIVSAVTSGATVRDFTTTTVTTNGMLVTLQSLLAVVGTSTWKIQHAPDSSGSPGTFVDLLTFDVVNGTGAQTKEVPVGTTIYPHIRARCTAITGSAQVAIAAARRF